MHITALIPALVAAIGLLMFLLCTSNPNAKRIGEIMFAAGLLVFLFYVGGNTLHLNVG